MRTQPPASLGMNPPTLGNPKGRGGAPGSTLTQCAGSVVVLSPPPVEQTAGGGRTSDSIARPHSLNEDF